MLGLLFLAVTMVVIAVPVGLLLWWLDTDDRQVRRRRELKAIKEVRVSANHQDLFLLVNDLVLLQGRGYIELFPDVETLDRAKRALDNYRQEIGP